MRSTCAVHVALDRLTRAALHAVYVCTALPGGGHGRWRRNQWRSWKLCWCVAVVAALATLVVWLGGMFSELGGQQVEDHQCW